MSRIHIFTGDRDYYYFGEIHKLRRLPSTEFSRSPTTSSPARSKSGDTYKLINDIINVIKEGNYAKSSLKGRQILNNSIEVVNEEFDLIRPDENVNVTTGVKILIENGTPAELYDGKNWIDGALAIYNNKNSFTTNNKDYIDEPDITHIRINKILYPNIENVNNTIIFSSK